MPGQAGHDGRAQAGHDGGTGMKKMKYYSGERVIFRNYCVLLVRGGDWCNGGGGFCIYEKDVFLL